MWLNARGRDSHRYQEYGSNSILSVSKVYIQPLVRMSALLVYSLVYCIRFVPNPFDFFFKQQTNKLSKTIAKSHFRSVLSRQQNVCADSIYILYFIDLVINSFYKYIHNCMYLSGYFIKLFMNML